jgi:two-component system sensor histidine kinase RstB
MVSRVLKNSIFLRIYAGLVVLVVVVAAFCYLLVQVINYQRAQEYREYLTDGISYVISEGVSRQPQKQQKLDWISDASDLLELPIYYVDAARVELSRTEKKRIAEQKSVVRYDANNGVGYIIIGLKDDAKHYLYIKVDKLGERQMKALPIFVLDYLIFYPGQEREYLERIKKHFYYPITIANIKDINLDSEQIGRLRQDQSILLYKDSATVRGTTISIVSPMPNHPAQVLILGPVPMFNWMPFQLSAGITLFSLFLLSLGVYGLILPLERKIRQVRHALNKMKSGDLSLRVPKTWLQGQIDACGEHEHLHISPCRSPFPSFLSLLR